MPLFRRRKPTEDPSNIEKGATQEMVGNSESESRSSSNPRTNKMANKASHRSGVEIRVDDARIDRPYDAVSVAATLREDGQFAEAEKYYRLAVNLYRDNSDLDGMGFALGRLGDFFESIGEIQSAVEAYDRSIAIGTAVPASFQALLGIYSAGGDEEAFFRTADQFAESLPSHVEEVAASIIGRVKVASKSGAPDVSELWMLRVEGWCARYELKHLRFEAWGERGRIVESEGDLERAIGIYEEAISSGSLDRTTFTRLLMAYEKRKRFDDALELARWALGIQRDVAWENDLRKRISRLESKLTPSASKADPDAIPAFSIRLGAKSLSLVKQTSFRAGIHSMALSQDSLHLALSIGTSKSENWMLVRTGTHDVTISRTLPVVPQELLSTSDDGYIAVNSVGTIGNGATELLFLSSNGEIRARRSLPDKYSEIRTQSGRIVVGCRDGYLYSFDQSGRAGWKFLVPEDHSSESDSPYLKSCPYYVRLSADGKTVVFSSWSRVFAVGENGKRKWTWVAEPNRREFDMSVPIRRRAPLEKYYLVLGLRPNANELQVRKAFRKMAMETHPDRNPNLANAATKFREVVQAYEAIVTSPDIGSEEASEGKIRFQFTGPTPTIYGLAISSNGETSIATASDGSLNFIDSKGRLTRRLVASEGAGWLEATPDLSRVIYSHWNGLNFYSNGGLTAVFPGDRLAKTCISPSGTFVAAWTGNQLSIISMDGVAFARVEFVKSVSDVAFTSKRTIAVAAGKLFEFSLI